MASRHAEKGERFQVWRQDGHLSFASQECSSGSNFERTLNAPFPRARNNCTSQKIISSLLWYISMRFVLGFWLGRRPSVQTTDICEEHQEVCLQLYCQQTCKRVIVLEALSCTGLIQITATQQRTPRRGWRNCLSSSTSWAIPAACESYPSPVLFPFCLFGSCQPLAKGLDTFANSRSSSSFSCVNFST